MTRPRLLVFLVLLFSLACFYAWRAMPRQHRAVSMPATTGSAERPRSKAAAETPVDLRTFVELPRDYRTPLRNPFSELYPPPPEGTAVDKEAPEQTTKIVLQQPQQTNKLSDSDQPPSAPIDSSGPPPMPPLRVLGYLEKRGEQMVFLGSQEGRIFLLNKGESFADGLLVSELDGHQVTILRPATEQRLTLTLRSAPPQRLPASSYQSERPDFVAPPSAAEESAQPAASSSDEAGVERPGTGADNPFLRALRKAQK